MTLTVSGGIGFNVLIWSINSSTFCSVESRQTGVHTTEATNMVLVLFLDDDDDDDNDDNNDDNNHRHVIYSSNHFYKTYETSQFVALHRIKEGKQHGS